MKPHICITVLTVNERHGWIHPELSDWMIYLAQRNCAGEAAAPRVTFRRIHNQKPYEHARTAAVQQFINDNQAIERVLRAHEAERLTAIDTDTLPAPPELSAALTDTAAGAFGLAEPYTHLLMVDNDTIPFFLGKFVDLPALALFAKDVIAAPVPINRDDANQLNAYMELTPEQRTEPRDEYRMRSISPAETQAAAEAGGLLKVDRVGFGACMIARRVLEAMPYPFVVAPTPENLRKEIERIDNGWPLGEDIRFCENATRAGFEVWTHYEFMCGHSHEINLLRNMVTRSEFETMLAADPRNAHRVKPTRVKFFDIAPAPPAKQKPSQILGARFRALFPAWDDAKSH